MVFRRDVLSTVAIGVVAGVTGAGIAGTSRAASGPPPQANHEGYPFRRDGDRIEFVDADPDFGFNYPYCLATPETFRSEPVPLMVEMNNALKGQGVDDLWGPVRDQINRFELQGPWLSEELGVPHLIPVVPRPDGEPVSSIHETISLDREAMLLEETDLERLDRQLLRMADHAREHRLGDHRMHEKVVFYGNSSGGVVGERMAAMHPGEVLAVAAGGLNGFVVLPFAELGGRTLNYPVGTADFESIIGKPYDREAHAAVDKFFFQGGADPKNRLPMDHRGDSDVWSDLELMETARRVYGADMAADRFPRCHNAFVRAGVDAQFRIYPEMGHNSEPASHDVLDFLRRSIEGEDVGDFGQRLEIPLDTDPEVVEREAAGDGERLEFGLSGSYPPPEGIVSYAWTFGDGSSGSGLPVSHTYQEPGSYEVTVSMETPVGQRFDRTTEVTVERSPTATPGSPTGTEEDGAGPGVVSAMAGLGSAVGYLVRRYGGESPRGSR